jgi:ABC-type multidrug transport system ATPase subunit
VHRTEDLMEAVADKDLSVVLSSHIVSELERTCDYLVILAEGQIQVARKVVAMSLRLLNDVVHGPGQQSEADDHYRQSQTYKQPSLRSDCSHVQITSHVSPRNGSRERGASRSGQEYPRPPAPRARRRQ